MNKIYLGDCLVVMDELISQGVKVDAIITDPPYGTTACKWDSIIPFDEMWKRLNQLIKPNGAIVLFGSQPFSSALVMSNPKQFRYEWIWVKNKPSGALNANIRPMKNHEAVLVFYNKQPIFNKILEPRECNDASRKRLEYEMTGFVGSNTYQGTNTKKSKYDPLQRNPTTVKSFSLVPNPLRIHPTQKPVALIEYLIKTYTNENELILDFTIGSGTSAVAALNTNRRYIGIEKDENYYNITLERIETYSTR